LRSNNFLHDNVDWSWPLQNASTSISKTPCSPVKRKS
jgi:hypothetical protein